MNLPRLLRRYSPFIVGFVTLLLVVAILPSVSPRPGEQGIARRQAGTADAQAAAGQVGGGSGVPTGAGGSAAATGGNSGPGGGSPAAPTGGSLGSGKGTVVDQSQSQSAAGAAGLNRNGIRCGPGVRQVTWSRYSPSCLPVFHGSNGGATAHGVTGDTVTITYRVSNSGEAAVLSAEEGAAGTSDTGLIADLQTFVSYFNQTYELYGRHVVLKSFNGQGDWVQEEQGQNLAAAQADAVQAHDLGAFADMSLTSNTQPYDQDLAQEHVLSFGAVFMPQSWFEKYAPYTYSVVPTGTKWAELWANTVCVRMAGLPAKFAGDAATQARSRKFGMLVGDAPTYQEDGNELSQLLHSQCGVPVAKRAAYTIDFSQYPQQAVSIVAQMKSAQVTSLVCGCDPIMMAALARAADQQQYFPEWLTVYWGDPGGRLSSTSQWAHALTNAGQSPKATATESYRAYRLARPGGTPAEQYFPAPYEALLQIFAGLQAAGPNLTPYTFQAGLASLPPSLPGGDYGDWSFGAGSFTPGIDTRLGWWDNNATSNYDGSKGAWENCENGHLLHYATVADYGVPHTQLHCFGS